MLRIEESLTIGHRIERSDAGEDGDEDPSVIERELADSVSIWAAHKFNAYFKKTKLDHYQTIFGGKDADEPCPWLFGGLESKTSTKDPKVRRISASIILYPDAQKNLHKAQPS